MSDFCGGIWPILKFFGMDTNNANIDADFFRIRFEFIPENSEQQMLRIDTHFELKRA